MGGIAKVIGLDRSVNITPTITTSAYAAGDQVGGIQTLSDVFPDIQRSVNWVSTDGSIKYPGHLILQSISITDLSEQDAAFDFFFFNRLPTVASSDNSALNIADSQAVNCVGHVSFSGTYADAGGFSIASQSNINLMLPQISDYSTNDLFVVVSTSGTPTYAGASDLTFKYSFFVD